MIEVIPTAMAAWLNLIRQIIETGIDKGGVKPEVNADQSTQYSPSAQPIR